MQPIIATSFHTEAISALLRAAHFHNLPEWEDARPVLESAHSMVIEQNGELVLWAGFHKDDGIYLDLVISPACPKGAISKGLCKQVLAYGFSLTHDVRMVVECYNPKGVKAALAMGFSITPEGAEKQGWVRLALRRDEFERKFLMRG